MKNNKKGFMLMEMVVVMAIMGIMLTMANPTMVGGVAKARLKLIRNDVSVMELQLKEYLEYYDELPLDEAVPIEELQGYAAEGRLHDAYGVTDKVYPAQHHKLSRDFTRASTLVGEFYMNHLGKVYYVSLNPQK